MKTKHSMDSIFIDIFVYIGVGLFTLICFLPFLYVFTYSITPYAEYLKQPMNFLPREINFEAYIAVFQYKLIRTGFYNTFFITIVGTIMHLFLLVCTAYPMTKDYLKGRNFLMTLFIITMFFGGGMIPNYYLIRKLHMINTLWSLIIPGVLSTYSLILMKNFINEIPDSLEEAAVIDGANEIKVLTHIILPLSVPALATLALFYAVGQWNSFFSATIYVTKRTLWPLQLVLRELVVENNNSMNEVQRSMSAEEQGAVLPFTIRMATIMASMLPIMCVYPFLQKYFMKGLFLGSVKG